MSAPGKDLVFALLMQDLKCWGDRIKYRVVNLLIKGITDRCPRQLVEMESVGKGESVALFFELSESPSAVVCLFNAKSSYCLCLVLVYVRVYFGIPLALNYNDCHPIMV